MIEKQYYQNVNIRKPRDYFERWYADVWNRRIGRPTAAPGVLEHVLKEELEQYDAEIDTTEGYRFNVVFNNDASYTMFALRWG